jgi:predicted permease
LWSYICAFLLLRAISLLVSIGWVVLQVKDGGCYIGEVAVNWLALTWISTVILGIPIAQAVFGSADEGQFYGLLAGISSFIFQLPLQLLFLECHALEHEYLKSNQGASNDPSNNASITDEEEGRFVEGDTGHLSKDPTVLVLDPNVSPEEGTHMETTSDAVVPLMLWTQFARRRDVWWSIVTKIVRNPVLWGISVGFVLSLSTCGPRFLNPSSDEFIPGLEWIFRTCAWIGACVSPVSLFAMGVWMQDQGKKLFEIPWRLALLFMLAKLFIVPLGMVGLAKALNLNNEAAVLIAALPISRASFSLAGHYKIGEATLSANVALGTALLLPTILIWNIVMNEIGLFPIPSDV